MATCAVPQPQEDASGKEARDPQDHDFGELSSTPGLRIRAQGDASESYTTTGTGSVRGDRTGKEYPLMERLVETQSGRSIHMTYIDFGPAYLPVHYSERTDVVPPAPPAADNPLIDKDILEGTQLPARAEFQRALAAFDSNKSDRHDNFYLEHGLYEVFTQEYIRALGGYLEQRIGTLRQQTGKPVTIVEVGAGDGRLTHFLQEELRRCGVQDFRMIATDSGAWRIPPQYPVEHGDAKTAVWDYQPQIVLSSWMPKYTDWTGDIRKEPSVQEYILIGPKDSGTCGDSWETWGNPAESTDPPPSVQDGFERVELPELTTLQYGQKDRDGMRYSSTVSFRRKGKSNAAEAA